MRRPMSRSTTGRRCLLLLAALAATLGLGSDMAIAGNSLEYKVKGAFLYKFGSFVEWPPDVFPDAHSPFVIGVFGKDPFGPTLNRMVQGRFIHGRPVVVRRYGSVDRAKAAQILFIGALPPHRLERIISQLRGLSILTVGDRPLPPGGVVNFVIVHHKVRIEIDPQAAKAAGLKISSQLLDLAIIVDNTQRWTKR